MRTRIPQVLKGLGALAVLAVLVGGVPWSLWHFVGWPLPHHLPSAGQVGQALNRQGIPDQTLVDTLAVAVWATWAMLVASIVVEVPAALAGRRPPHLPFASAFQPVTGRLVATVIVACLTLTPRPTHTTTAAKTASFMVRRPVAALVADDTVRASVTSSLRFAVPTTTTPTTATAEPAPVATTTYVVQRGDTLWGIAERQLSDPLRWSEIYQLNLDRPQPGGVTLTDPHWIDPGWTLLLPSPRAPTQPPGSVPEERPMAAPSTSVAPATPATTIPATPVPVATAPTVTAPARPTWPHLTPTTTHSSSPPSTDRAEVSDHENPVWLPSGSVVAGSFAAGVAATVTIGQLRRRHAYRYRPPEPGRRLAPEPCRPTIQHLRQAVAVDVSVDESDQIPVMPFEHKERIAAPGRLDLATCDGEVVTVDLTDPSGVAIHGEGADDAARALIAALLVRAEPVPPRSSSPRTWPGGSCPDSSRTPPSGCQAPPT